MAKFIKLLDEYINKDVQDSQTRDKRNSTSVILNIAKKSFYIMAFQTLEKFEESHRAVEECIRDAEAQ